MTYAEKKHIEAMVGYTIDDIGTSRPTETHLAEMLIQADSIINSEAKRETNGDDKSKRLRVIACSLVFKMIVKMLALTDPDIYGFIEIELTDDQKRIIHMEQGVWTSKTWEI
jgi:hypothetical protein